MKLDAFAVALPEYPWLPPVRPFQAWSSAAPTETLDWYCAYNQTKHDREDAFAAATLERAVASVCGGVALLAAQYGIPYGLGQRTSLSDQFAIVAAPQWTPADVYIYPYDRAVGWQPINFQF